MGGVQASENENSRLPEVPLVQRKTKAEVAWPLNSLRGSQALDPVILVFSKFVFSTTKKSMCMAQTQLEENAMGCRNAKICNSL